MAIISSPAEQRPGREPPDEEAWQLFWTVCRPGYLVALFVVCWAVNVHVFGRFRVDYFAALGLSADEHVSPRRAFFLASALAGLLAFVRFVALSEPPSLFVISWILSAYLGALLALFSWLPAPLDRHLRWRRPLAKALSRCFWPDGRKEVPFIEVLVADGLTSMAKVFFDLALGSCVVAGAMEKMLRYSLMGSGAGGPKRLGFLDDAVLFGPGATVALDAPRLRLGESLQQCQQTTLPFLAWALPFLIRAQQCIVSSRNANDPLARRLHLVNLMKYCSALPIIFFAWCFARSNSLHISALGKEDYEAFWAAAAVVNAVFSFMWDLVMDWGLLQPAPLRTGTFGLRPVLFYRSIWGFYHLAILTNLWGRTFWTLRWSPDASLVLGSFLLSSLQQSVEVLRRGLWNVLRVEWECVKKGIPRTDKCFPV